MPYPTIQSLPAAVKVYPMAKQRRWQAIWNDVHKKTGSEEQAFKAANAILKEEYEMKKNGYRKFEFESDLAESVGGAALDKEGGVIGGVVLLTGEKVSRNKTFYTKKALNEAVARYEGAKMYIDHPKADEGSNRSVRDLGGVYRNVRIEEGKFLKADLQLLPNPEIRNLVMPIAESTPKGVGLSIRDRGKGRDENGIFLVEGSAPKGPFSIDLVTEASVNETLFESEQGGDEDMKIEEIKLEDLQNGNPSLVESIRADERAAVLKEYEEAIKKGETADKVILEAKKDAILAAAKFEKDVAEAVKELIAPDHVTIEVAEGIVKKQAELIEKMKPAPADPKVKNAGGSKDGNLEEGHEPTDEELVESIMNA